MPRVELVLGPLLRYAGTESATFWVETSAPCEVEILGKRTRTFTVEGHHYALLLVDDLEPDVGDAVRGPPRRRARLAARRRPSASRRPHAGRRAARAAGLRLVPRRRAAAGLARGAVGRRARARRASTRSGRTRERCSAARRNGPTRCCCSATRSTRTRSRPRRSRSSEARRDTSEPPGEQVADFEEYTRLYRESWSDPDIRWLLSTVPSAMIFDDHDVHDDWNISWSWVEEMRAKPWWDARITGAFMAYWIYQHIGNLSPPELAEEAMLELVKADDDAGPRLREAARMWDRESAASRWAYYRDFGDSRLLVARLARRARARRRPARDGRRGGVGLDRRPLARRVRPSRDREHAARLHAARHPPPRGVERGGLRRALGQASPPGSPSGSGAASTSSTGRRSTSRSTGCATGCAESATGEAGTTPPASIVVIGGDVHNSYVAEVDLGERHAQPRLPDRLLAVPEPARAARAAHRPRHRLARRRRGLLAARQARRRRPAVGRRGTSARRRTFDNTIGELELDRALRPRHAPPERPRRRGRRDRLVVLDRTELAADEPT